MTGAAHEQGSAEERPVRSSRVSAYAIVVDDGRILLTQLADDTPAPGIWTLPGGGVDHGEAPADAVVREVLEETGHRLVDPQLLDVGSSHFMGRAPGGRLEDFHGIWVVYRAGVERAEEPRVLEVDGSTARAAWVPLAELDHLDLGEQRVPLTQLVARHVAG